MVTPSGTFSYSYDGAQRPTGLTSPLVSGDSFPWSYRDHDWLLSQTLPGSVSTTYTQNAMGILTRLQTCNGSGVLADFGGTGGMLYDAAGNRTSLPASETGSMLARGTNSHTYNSTDRADG